LVDGRPKAGLVLGIHENQHSVCRRSWIALLAPYRGDGDAGARAPCADRSDDRGHLGPAGVAV